MKILKIDLVENKLLYKEHNVLLENGYYYKVWEDVDTESVTFHAPNGDWIRNLLVVFSGHFIGVNANRISEAIILDIKKNLNEEYRFEGNIPFYDE